MKSELRLGRLATIVVGVLFASAAQAVVLISNLPGNDATQSAALNALRIKGMSFTTPAGTPYILDAALLRLNANPNAVPLLEIRADAAGVPGASLHTLTNPGSFSTGFVTYTFTSNFAMAASTKYWLVLSQPAATTPFDWKASSPAQAPTGLATHTGSVFTTNGGSTWTTSSILTSYELQGTLVPEPATFAALGLGALALLRKRKKV